MLSASKLALSLLIASTLASAADICAFTSRGCSGNYSCCAGIREGLGKMYGDQCHTQTGAAGSSSGSVCLSVFNGPGWVAARAAAWDADTRSRRRSVKFGARADDDDSEIHRIPEDTKFADAEKLLNDGQFDELFKFESVAIEQ
ncbi:unnamed protein product [Cyclocybe aegerita]|uniref:Uncharacterized protein n=1 Tax=Cyclocybe aegerita TaxID=1973307 RepID=A0A8S0XT17_CYCAE|nr:unnamed protein product [Cyclocybe aegerita]